VAKVRKRHVQQELDFKPWGGKRKGAGRPAKSSRSSERHETRPELRPGSVLLLTLRAEQDVGHLRRPDAYHAVRYALWAVIERPDFRIAQISIQSNHVHLIVEADSKDALSRGIQAFEISAAKNLNSSIIQNGERRRGRVFSDRYHQRLLT